MPPLNNPTAAGSGFSGLVYEQFIEPFPVANFVNVQNLSKRWKQINWGFEAGSAATVYWLIVIVGTTINNMQQVWNFQDAQLGLGSVVSFIVPPGGWYQFGVTGNAFGSVVFSLNNTHANFAYSYYLS